jgi:uncharacterized protein (DUF608 family)
LNGYSHFAIKAESDLGSVLDARVLHGDLQPGSYGTLSGIMNNRMYGSFGFGPPRELLAGLPHFSQVEFNGQFPVAGLRFLDASFPGHVRLTALNPFIPLNADDSGVPAAFFEFQITNPTTQPITYTIAGTLGNPLPENNLHTFHQSEGMSYIRLASDGLNPSEPGFGELCLGSDAPETSAQLYWYRGRWFDNLEAYWQDFAQPGALKPRSYAPEQAGRDNNASLAATLTLDPGKRGRLRFVIAWHFPNFHNYWDAGYCQKCEQQNLPTTWKNYYATRFGDAGAVIEYCLGSWTRLVTETMKFKDALFASSLPVAALEAVSANLAVLKSPTVARLEDGTFYGFEGCHPNAGCCEGSCTHVWNYAQALPFLFPQLERSMRETDFRYNQRSDGAMRFRIPLPPLPADEHFPFRACADGQFGGVLKTYRDWKIFGDRDWLRKLWPAVKKSIEFAWADSNLDRWDPEKRGVLTGRVHQTLDMELFGPDPWLTGFYLGALKAGAEMAAALGDAESSVEYLRIFTRGKAWVANNLFNGEYFQQTIDLDDRSLLFGPDAEAYWDAEHEEIKYQIGEGCGIDQLLAQWHANLYGLGDLFDPVQTHTALRSLFRYNFVASLREHFNPHRIFSLDDEAGLLVCAYPPGKRRPAFPTPYAHETWTGTEYAAAAQMIQNGMHEEGLAVVRAVRDRHDGEKRNPWNEFECGSNYARSLSSYSLLNAYSGFEFDLTRQMIGFAPVEGRPQPFRCFWSLDPAWGAVAVGSGWAELEVLGGQITLKSLRLPELCNGMVVQANLSGQQVRVETGNCELVFPKSVTIQAGQTLVVRWEEKD